MSEALTVGEPQLRAALRAIHKLTFEGGTTASKAHKALAAIRAVAFDNVWRPLATLPVVPPPSSMAVPLEEQLKRAYYFREDGTWGGGTDDFPEWDRWHAVAKVVRALFTLPVGDVEPRSSLGHETERAGEAVQRPAIPEGWMLVPLEPTDEMQCWAFESDVLSDLVRAALNKGGWPYTCREAAEACSSIYRLMVEHAPPPPTGRRTAAPKRSSLMNKRGQEGIDKEHSK